MQLVCQRNSLNRRDVTAQEIAELSEILTVQENKGGALVANRLCRCHGLEGRRGRGRMYLNVHAPPLTHSINRSSHENCFRLTRGLRVHLPNGAKTLAMSSSSLLWQSQDGSLLAPSFGEHSRSVLEPMDDKVFGRPGNVMAHVIEFYIPARFKPKVKWVPQEERGKVIAFPSDLKKSA